MHIDHPDYTIRLVRYAGRWNGKPQVAVKTRPDGTGLKTRAARLIGDGLKGRYSNRCGAYIVSPAKAARFVALYAQGWDANFFSRELIPPPEPC